MRTLAALGIVFADTDDNDLALGGGALFQLSFDTPVDIGLKTTYHTLVGADYDLFDTNVLGIVSDEIPGSPRLNWYANTGLHYVDADNGSRRISVRGTPVVVVRGGDDDDTAFTMGAGLVYEFTSQLEGYLGIDALARVS